MKGRGIVASSLSVLLLPQGCRLARTVSPGSSQLPRVGLSPNQSLQVTFDPSRTFAFAKARAASNAPELKRYTAFGNFLSSRVVGHKELVDY